MENISVIEPMKQDVEKNRPGASLSGNEDGRSRLNGGITNHFQDRTWPGSLSVTSDDHASDMMGSISIDIPRKWTRIHAVMDALI